MELLIGDKERKFDDIVNNTKDYAKNKDHFWNLAIRTSKLPFDRMYVEGIIKSNDTQVMQCMKKAIKDKNMKILFEKPNSVSGAIKEKKYSKFNITISFLANEKGFFLET